MAALEAQRSILGDSVVDLALDALRDRLAALEAAEQHTQQRKQATILFADVSGFTALSETTDAEVMATVMNDLWLLVDRAIVDHGGHIDKHIGDAIMALWGIDTAREDDPEQAIRAALALQTAVGTFCQTHDLPLAVRVGLNTGPVIITPMGTRGELTAMGDAVNLASRLEQAAPVGGILMSHNTYRHVRGIFDVEPRPPLAVKGKTDPVRSYVVQRAKTRAFRMATRGVEGVETRMIGRDAELMALQTAYSDATEGRETCLVVVVGEAGVGKSRLLYEFDNWLELRPERVVYFKGRVTPMLQSVPHSLFRDLFAFRFDIRDSDSTAEAIAKFRAGFMDGGLEPAADETGVATPLTLTADQADIVGHWLGFDFSSSPAVDKLLGSPEFRSSAQAYLIRYFRHLTTTQPVVVLLEDIHWADNGSLDLITHLIESIPAAHLLVVAITRPSLYERRPRWGEGETALSRIDLRPLSRRASRALVDEILREVDDIPQSLHALIVESAEGNPFFTEELIRMLIDQGVIVRGVDGESAETEYLGSHAEAKDAARWRVATAKVGEIKVPSTLIGLLQARLDGLPASESDLLQRAAVVGRLFWDGIVAELAQSEQADIQPGLGAIRGRELIFQHEKSSFAGNDEFMFKHSLLRDVAYERVLLKWRKTFHSQVARWLETHAGERLGEYLVQIAEHYQLAGENERAAAHLLRAGNVALRANAYAAARQDFERVLALDEDNRALAVEATVRLGEVFHHLGELAAAEHALVTGLDGARHIGDQRLEAEALLTLSENFIKRGNLPEADRIVKEALPVARAAGKATWARAMAQSGATQWNLGDLSAAELSAESALTLAREVNDRTLEGQALNVQALIASQQGNRLLARQRHEETLAFARTNGNLLIEARSLLNLGNESYLNGDYPAARSFGLAANRQFHELGETLSEMFTILNLAQADLQLGDRPDAWRRVREVLRLAVMHTALSYVPAAVMVAAEILAAEGDRAQSLVWLWLCQEDPTTLFQVKQEIDDIFERWAVDEGELAVAKTAAAEQDLATIAAEILAGDA